MRAEGREGAQRSERREEGEKKEEGRVGWVISQKMTVHNSKVLSPKSATLR